jgi:hypothetical protein
LGKLNDPMGFVSSMASPSKMSTNLGAERGQVGVGRSARAHLLVRIDALSVKSLAPELLFDVGSLGWHGTACGSESMVNFGVATAWDRASARRGIVCRWPWPSRHTPCPLEHTGAATKRRFVSAASAYQQRFALAHRDMLLCEESNGKSHEPLLL